MASAKVKIGWAASLSLLIYTVVCGILTKNQIKLLYRPQILTKGHEDFISICKLNDNDELFGWIENEGKEDAIIYCGGSSEAVELRRQDLANHFKDYTIYVVPYRGFGPNKHLATSEKNLKEDIEILYEYVIGKHNKVNVIGRSLGTSIASHLCARKQVYKVALITPFSSIVSVAQNRYKWVPIKILLNDKHEVWKDISQIKIPILACLAGQDKITPHKFWYDLKKHITTKVDIFEDKDTDHITIASSPKTWLTINNFFKENK